MTTQIDTHTGIAEVTDSVDLAKVEDFAGKVAVDQPPPTTALLVYLGDRLGLWRRSHRSTTPPARNSPQSSGLAERYVLSGCPRRLPAAT